MAFVITVGIYVNGDLLMLVWPEKDAKGRLGVEVSKHSLYSCPLRLGSVLAL